MNDIVRSWRASMEMLLPHNCVPLLMVTLKNVMEVYGALLRSFWWFLLGGALMVYALPHPLVFIAWAIGWCAIVIEAARPSLLPKTMHYFAENAFSCFPLLLLFLVSCCVPAGVLYLVAPYGVLVMLFLCDAHYRLYDMLMAPLRAAKLSCAIAPLYVLIALLLYASGRLLCCSVLVPTMVMLLLVMPIVTVLLSRVYVMWVHREYKQYFERCW